MSSSAVPQPTFDPRRPFSRATARAAGISPQMLLSRMFHKIGWDMYVAAEIPITTQLRAAAVIDLVPAGSHISHHTAAELWGAVVPAEPAVHVTLPSANRRPVRRGVQAHYGGGNPRTTIRKGLPISTPEQAFLELAAVGLGLVDLVVVADGFIKAGHTSTDRLIEAAHDWTGRGRSRAQRAAGLARSGVDSAMETRLRLLIVLAGCPNRGSI